MITVRQVADYFLTKVEEDSGDLISNLKIQKLVYYAQGFHLALYDTPLYPEEIQAWLHGPVVPTLYHDYKQYGAGPIPLPEGINFSCYSEEVRDLLDEVYNVYGQFSAWKLRQMTHDDIPFRDAYSQGANTVISPESLREYFKTQLTNVP